MIHDETEILTLITTIRSTIQSLFPDAILPNGESLQEASTNDVHPKDIDHTILKATATASQIDALVQEAIQYGFASVCVNGRWVKSVARQLEGTTVKTCAVIGFPLGAMTSKVKAFEAQTAIADGATEIDMVISIGDVRAKDWMTVFQDIRTVVEAVGEHAIIKVILETGYLTDVEIIFSSLIASIAGADFVKTSTGFAGSGATVHHVQLMRQTVG